MIEIFNNSTDPFFNLAVEEFILTRMKFKSDLFMIWRNAPTVVIGKNQNIYEEVNLEFAKTNAINVVRRSSGGGSVYHDLGNINYTFVKENKNHIKNNFTDFELIIAEYLKEIGLNPCINTRNDIMLAGKKISGNAQYYFEDRVLHHGTLLFNVDVSVLSRVLKVDKLKFSSKGVKSFAESVTNISNYTNLTCDAFIGGLREYMRKKQGCSSNLYYFTEDDISTINKIRDRYASWDWNYGMSPECEYSNRIRFKGGTVSVLLQVSRGEISDFKLYGDYFEMKPVKNLNSKFIGLTYNKDILCKEVSQISISDYIYMMTEEEFRRLLSLE